MERTWLLNLELSSGLCLSYSQQPLSNVPTEHKNTYNLQKTIPLGSSNSLSGGATISTSSGKHSTPQNSRKPLNKIWV